MLSAEVVLSGFVVSVVLPAFVVSVVLPAFVVSVVLPSVVDTVEDGTAFESNLTKLTFTVVFLVPVFASGISSVIFPSFAIVILEFLYPLSKSSFSLKTTLLQVLEFWSTNFQLDNLSHL